MKNKLLQLIQNNQKVEKKFEVRNSADGPAEVFLYDAIGSWYGIGAEALVKELRDLGDRDVVLRIDSPGGDVFEARAIATAIAQHKGHVTAQIDGLAASAATYIAIAADKVVIADGAFFMIHNAWTLAVGNADELDETSALLRKVDDSIVADYQRKTSLEPAQLSDWMKATTWFSSAEAVQHGFADELAASKRSTNNRWDLAAYGNAPAALLSQAPNEPQYDRAACERRLAMLERFAA